MMGHSLDDQVPTSLRQPQLPRSQFKPSRSTSLANLLAFDFIGHSAEPAAEVGEPTLDLIARSIYAKGALKRVKPQFKQRHPLRTPQADR